MYCLKCGRETMDNQVFCNACMEGMNHHPVKPDTPVNLPHRESPAAAKKQPHRKRPQSPEEQVIHLRKQVRRLTVLLAVLTVVLSLATAMLVKGLFSEGNTPVIGRNYTIDTTRQP